MIIQGEKRPWNKDKKVLAAAGLLIVAVAAAYANSFHGPFIFDDNNSIVDNPSIRHLWSARVLSAPPTCLTTVGRPIVNVSLAINYAAGGLNVWGYHAVNLVIHVLAALALFGLVRRTLLLPSMSERFGRASAALALAVALLWSLHPLQTESVAYIIQRAESIVGLFYLLTMYCFLRSATSPHGGAWGTVAVVACALGMASKEVMVSAPLVTLLYDRTFISGSFREAWRRRWALYLALACTWAILGLLVFLSAGQGGRPTGLASGNDVWEYARSQFVYIVHYLRLAFWPSGLTLDYGTGRIGDPARIVPCAIVVLLLVAATAAMLVRRPKPPAPQGRAGGAAWGFLGTWFFANLAPTSSILPLIGQVAAEHRMYVPLAAVAAGAVLGAYAAMKSKLSGARQTRALAAAGVLVLAASAALGWGTRQRNDLYGSALAIWNDAVEKRPSNYRAYDSRGIAYEIEGQYDAAVRDYDKAIELNPNYAGAYNNRGNAYIGLGRYDAAIRDYDKAIALKPNFADAYYGRGNAYSGMSLYNAAIKDFDRAIELNPNHEMAYINRGIARSNLSMGELAIRDFGKAIEINPGLAMAYGNRGAAYNSMGRYDAAVRDFDKAIELRPTYAKAYLNRAKAHYGMKAYDKAWADVRRCRELGGRPTPEFMADLIRASGRSE
jgi:tetratricopeptide (TPR) repeat protein